MSPSLMKPSSVPSSSHLRCATKLRWTSLLRLIAINRSKLLATLSSVEKWRKRTSINLWSAIQCLSVNTLILVLQLTLFEHISAYNHQDAPLEDEDYRRHVHRTWVDTHSQSIRTDPEVCLPGEVDTKDGTAASAPRSSSVAPTYTQRTYPHSPRIVAEDPSPAKPWQQRT